MCRMFAYAGRSRDDLIALCSALRSACEDDECLATAFPNAGRSHKDGWGYVIRVSGELHHYRSATSIYEDDHDLPEFADGQDIKAIFHGRLTTGDVVGDAIFSHPYVAAMDREILFFAHNGGLTDDVGKAVIGKVDSEWALDQIVKNGFASALPTMLEKTQSALNILLLTICRRDPATATIRYLNSYKGHGEDARDRYYQMYKTMLGGGGRTVFSSTLKKHFPEGAVEPVNYGTIESL
jgi:predicted glutamine amidotransferase